MLALDKFGCSIIVNEKALKEYVDPEVDAEKQLKSKTITRYVEAEMGAKFAVRLRINSNFAYKDADDICWHIYLDGVYRASTYVSEAEHAKPGQTLSTRDTCIVHTQSGARKMKFCFGSIVISTLITGNLPLLMRDTGDMEKGEDVGVLKGKHKDLSSIKVVVRRTEDGEMQDRAPKSPEDLSSKPVACKVLKGDARNIAMRCVITLHYVHLSIF